MERLKHRIHNFKIPIRSPRALFAVQCMYFALPIVGGWYLMQAIIPSEEEMRKRLEKSEVMRDKRLQESVRNNNEALQTVLDEAKAGRTVGGGGQ